jgi:RNA-directed DNA polymerase
MKTVGGLHWQMVQHENLLRAVHQAALGRREQPAVKLYLEHLEEELGRLHEQLITGRLECGQCVTFTIHDPKLRQITAPVFRERVLHHAVMNVCGPVLEKRLIHHTYACREGKGTHAALRTARSGAAAAPYFLKLDVRAYFASIPHERLQAALARVFREEQVLMILMGLVSVYSPGRACGLAIGTLVSQHLANFYLSPLDVCVLQDLRPAAYVRYMDDMALWLADATAACHARDVLIEHARSQLGLELKTAFINRSARGMDFLGHRVFPHRMCMNRVSRHRFKHKLRQLNHEWQTGLCSESVAQTRATSLVAATRQARSLDWRRRVIMTLGDRPQGVTACCAAAVGSTTAGTPDPPSATATRPTTATATSASVPPPAPAGCRSALMEPVWLPAPLHPEADETHSSRPRPVTPDVDASAAKAEGGSTFFSPS